MSRSTRRPGDEDAGGETGPRARESRLAEPVEGASDVVAASAEKAAEGGGMRARESGPALPVEGLPTLVAATAQESGGDGGAQQGEPVLAEFAEAIGVLVAATAVEGAAATPALPDTAAPAAERAHTAPARARLQAGALYMVGSALAFSVMTLLVKMVGRRLPSQEIVLARAVVSLVLSYALLRRAGVEPWGSERRLLVVRGIVGFLALSCVYYAVTHLPLAEATVIQYLYPTFTALLAAAALGERVSRVVVVASAISLAGVALVARPSFLFGGAAALDSLAVLAAVGGALMSATAYVIVRRLSATEHPLVIVFYFPLVTIPATLPLVWSSALWPQGIEWLLLLGVGISTQLGQVWVTRGIQAQPAGRAAAISYLQIPFAAVWGAMFFGELPGVLTVAGALLVLGATLAVAASRPP